MRARRLLAGASLALASWSGAQEPPPLDWPSERREELPYGRGDEVEVEGASPLVGPEAPAPRFDLRRVRIVGNTVLAPAVLEAATRPFVGRVLDDRALDDLREAVTQAYVERGYRSSGAVLPDQTVSDGELALRVVEGRISELRIEGNERLRSGYLRSRLWPDPDAPLHVPTLSRRLSLLQAEPRVLAVEAELRPGPALGTSVLSVRIREAHPLEAALALDNGRSPAIGPYTGELRAGLWSLLGFGERLATRLQVSEGLRDVGGELSLPLPVAARRSLLSAGVRYSESRVVESPFDALGIESDFLSLSLGAEHALFETVRDRIEVGARFEWRRGRTTVLGQPFSFSEGVDDGEAVVAPLRLIAAWTRRERQEVRALRTTVSFGLPVLGATDVDGAVSDAGFVSWILQGQWSRRFDDFFGVELVGRGDLQLASSPLLPLERFSLGGRASTRGFRENQVVRDQGFATSLELRLPVWQRPDGSPIAQLAPFVDGGHAWDHEDRDQRRAKGLAAAGLGLRVFPSEHVRGELYWGQRMTKAPRPRDDKDIQDYGLHFQLTAELP